MDASIGNGDVSQPSVVGEDGELQHVRRPVRRKPSITRNPEQLERRRRERLDSKVRFRDREGDSLTDSCPARSPSRDGIPSKEEIVENYAAACTKLKIKPLQRVLNYIRAVGDINVRQAELDLKGIRLDSRQCEALEEIFRWIQVETLIVESCGLEDEGLMAIMEMVEFYEGAFRLVLPNNNHIHRPTWLAMSRMLKKSPFVHYLDVAQTATDLHAVPLLGRALRVNCGLGVLHLERNGIAGARIVILAASLKVNTNLTHLYLGNNQLQPDDAGMLSAMLRCNKSLELLDLRENNLQDRGVVLLCQALAEQSAGLKALVLWSNRCSPLCISPLCHMLAVHTTLHTIELGRNRLCHEGGMDTLKQGFLASQSLCNVGLMEAGLDVEGAVALAEFIGVSQQLQHVNVQRNDIRVAGLMALTCALKLSETLVRLDIDKSIRVDKSQDNEIVRALKDAIAEYTFRNLQRATEVALRRQQEEARNVEETKPDVDAESGGDAPVFVADAEEQHTEENGPLGTTVESQSSEVAAEDGACNEPVEEDLARIAVAEAEAARTLDACLMDENEASEHVPAKLDIAAASTDADKDNGGTHTPEEEASEERAALFSPVADQSVAQLEEELAAALEELSPEKRLVKQAREGQDAGVVSSEGDLPDEESASEGEHSSPVAVGDSGGEHAGGKPVKEEEEVEEESELQPDLSPRPDDATESADQ